MPHSDGLLTRLGCDVDRAGFVSVDATGRTSAFGVWAAGDVVDPQRTRKREGPLGEVAMAGHLRENQAARPAAVAHGVDAGVTL